MVECWNNGITGPDCVTRSELRVARSGIRVPRFEFHFFVFSFLLYPKSEIQNPKWNDSTIPVFHDLGKNSGLVNFLTIPLHFRISEMPN
jgi:hypothetical protein